MLVSCASVVYAYVLFHWTITLILFKRAVRDLDLESSSSCESLCRQSSVVIVVQTEMEDLHSVKTIDSGIVGSSDLVACKGKEKKDFGRGKKSRKLDDTMSVKDKNMAGPSQKVGEIETTGPFQKAGEIETETEGNSTLPPTTLQSISEMLINMQKRLDTMERRQASDKADARFQSLRYERKDKSNAGGSGRNERKEREEGRSGERQDLIVGVSSGHEGSGRSRSTAENNRGDAECDTVGALNELMCEDVSSSDEDVDESFTSLEGLFNVEEVVGDPVLDKIANIVDNALLRGSDKTTIKATMDKYPKPQNIKHLNTPDVNPEIWKMMPPGYQRRDLELRKTQSLSLKTLTAAVSGLDHIKHKASTKAAIDPKFLFDTFSNILVLTSTLFSDITKKRKDSIRPCLTAPYTDLCKPEQASITSNDYLFGSNLSEKVKCISDANKITSQIVRNEFSKNSRARGPFPRQTWKGIKSERGRGQGMYSPYQKARSGRNERRRGYNPQFQGQNPTRN